MSMRSMSISHRSYRDDDDGNRSDINYEHRDIRSSQLMNLEHDDIRTHIGLRIG